MTEGKKIASTSKPISFRFKPETLEVLNDLVGMDIKCAHCGKQLIKFTSKMDVIEDSLAGLVAFLLQQEIAKEQIRQHRRNPQQLFHLYIMVRRAERGEEGYHFTDKDKKKRFVRGPEGNRIFTHMFEEPRKNEDK
jgi:hypothetical protein